VVVSIVHIIKQHSPKVAFLDGKCVGRISAYLAEGINDNSPARLAQNPYFSLGAKIYGQGFLFADESPDCTPLEVASRLIETKPDLAARIRPYIGGEEILSHPSQEPDRLVITLSDLQSEDELDHYPELRDIVRQMVKPKRDILGTNPNNIPLKKRWWAFQAHRPELQKRLSTMEMALVAPRVNPRFGFAMLPANLVFSEQVVVFCIDKYSGFAAMQSRVHELWARSFSSTALELIRYAPSDCYVTFPFPVDWETHDFLDAAGKRYDVLRSKFLVTRGVGITKLYNLLHSVSESGAEIEDLRMLHNDLDSVVLRSYGWNDLADRAAPEFLTEDTEPDHRYQGRLFWPGPFRDEVLARLLDLNRARAEEERRLGITASPRAADTGEELEDA
jgi:hypothetical protein